MKTSLVIGVLTLSGCAGLGPKSKMEQLAHDADVDEVLHCTRSDTTNITKFGNFRLVFMSRDFVNTMLVWMDPDTGKTVVIKKNDRKTCIVSNSIPNLVFTPYDKNAKAINSIIEKVDANLKE